ncbi:MULTISPECIES: 2-keto-3-deoxygluconate permease [Cytobacillus]|jgi:2-keto-3-deoxygluconate permease|uniref:2-keto-3-deoxygluconate permease n=3 Tax=Cytobacillus TaxID=2675230 RepID=A0A160MBN4_9BACI|nr:MULTISPECIES: 2-keto-3-deoxygluconate permease [Cytobacillus]EFV76242.1 2-keto-3-deoxygluconate permease [Bacillus sp. 2_A_57_CT2]MBY0156387.1 2-keto-3-deoxygluconate permease [Cytobacillus firmus]AND40252.1 2-keto-3-deoxygluconate permease [Cytobacillus oceanisediminis 2691]MBU8728456.1 2-keto-3-deoxygluconate permease [Cytobacillus oceanisediminis]MBU8769180.1 2-keto-3-deoxygluconate permease [Cytobacillus oceanisediminis]
MKIKATLERIPGGMMVVPLLIAAVLNTFAPDLLRIGNFTEALFVDGASALIALFLLCTGAQINVKSFGVSIGKGATLLATKWVVGAAFGLIAYMFAGENGLWLGLAPIAIIAAMTNSNGGLFVALVGQYGSKEDRAAYSLLALNDGPFLTMVALSIFGAMGFVDGMFSLQSFIAVLLPILVGMVLGNLDEEMRAFLDNGSSMLIPFFAFALGMGIDFSAIVDGGLSGIILGLLTVFVTGTAGYLVFKAFKWNPIVGAAEGSTAGNAVATPAAIAAASAGFAQYAELATVQVAASTVTTAILLPLYIAFLVKRLERKGYEFKEGNLTKVNG